MVIKSEVTSSPLIQFLLCGTYCFLFSYGTAFVGVYINDFNSNKPPDPPLRDIFIDYVPEFSYGFSVSDISTLILLVIWNLITIFHKDRFLLMKRYYILVGTFYLFRSILILSTTFPDTMGHECKPFINLNDIQAEEGTFSYAMHLFGLRMLFSAKIFFGGGLEIVNGVLICGDYLFSGHTAHITTLCYLIREYLPKKFDTLKNVTYVINIAGMFGVLWAHEHYLVDVFVGYFFTSLMSKYNHLKSKTPGPKSGWIPGFKFMDDPFDRYVANKYDTWADVKRKFIKQFNKTPKQIDVIV